MQNCHLAKLHTDLGDDWNDRGVADWANRTGTRLTDAMAAVPGGGDNIPLLLPGGQGAGVESGYRTPGRLKADMRLVGLEARSGI